MSRCYGMRLTVQGHNVNKREAIIEAANKEWRFDEVRDMFLTPEDEAEDSHRSFHTPRVPEQVVKIESTDITSLLVHKHENDREGVETIFKPGTLHEVCLIESSSQDGDFDIQFGDGSVAFSVPEDCYKIIDDEDEAEQQRRDEKNGLSPEHEDVSN